MTSNRTGMILPALLFLASLHSVPARAELPPLHTLPGHKDGITALSFSPDGRLLASGGSDSVVRLWDVRTGKPAYTIEGFSSAVQALDFSRDGKWLATGSRLVEAGQTIGGMIAIWDARVRPGTLEKTRMGHHSNVTGLAFSPDGRTLVSGSMDETVRMWDLRTDVEKEKLRWVGEGDQVYYLALSPDGRFVASSGFAYIYSNAEICIRDARTGSLKHRLRGNLKHQRPGDWPTPTCLAFSRDSRTLASAHTDEKIRLWDVETGRLKRTLPGHTMSIYGLAFLPDGKTLVSASNDKTVKFWDWESGVLKRSLNTPHGKYTMVKMALSPDGRLLATGDLGGEIKLWRVE